jgi:hypothetical protein
MKMSCVVGRIGGTSRSQIATCHSAGGRIARLPTVNELLGHLRGVALVPVAALLRHAASPFTPRRPSPFIVRAHGLLAFLVIVHSSIMIENQ